MKTRSLSSLFQDSPVQISQLTSGTWLIDFGRVAFGNLHLLIPAGNAGELKIHFGESLVNGRIDRNPPGAVRYACVAVGFSENGGWQVVAPGPDRQNTEPQAIALPAEWGVILPFRWIEIEGWPQSVNFETSQIKRRAAYATTWNDQAAAFESSSEMLNRIWELCRYSIKATTFAGIFVDGDRERIPYEADAYLNQLSHYACGPDPAMARATFDHLMNSPTWPTEWASHMIFMAYADWMYTGDAQWVCERYEALHTKLMPGRERADGLITSNAAQIQQGDLVDWPPGERDDFELTAVNTVVNAFQYRALVLMAELAAGLGKTAAAESFRHRAGLLATAYHQVFFDHARGIYRDGIGTNHASQHANLFPLAFGLTPAAHQATVLAYLKSKGMACSVYAAQYLMEAFFQAGAADHALQLMAASGNRSWRAMVESGTTITWELWDQSDRPKLSWDPRPDWTHAWGAAPANLLPRFVLGVQPLKPGYQRVAIRPQLGALTWAKGVVPTVHGPIRVQARREAQGNIALEVSAPSGVEIIR